MVTETKQRALVLLRQALANPAADFRDDQWEAIEALLERGERLLVVQRTGWGKSLVYFIATRLLRERGAGPTLIISPLLALMRNQVAAARQAGLTAQTINSSNREEHQSIMSRIRANKVDLLLISPERLAGDSFQGRVLTSLAHRIGLLVVDEAHCISDWGHDFRPDYQRIGHMLRALPPNIPVLATTATANNRVVDDVCTQLGPNMRLVRGSLARETLHLQNIRLGSPAARMAWLAEQIPRLPGAGIIYTLTTADARQLARWLRSKGIHAAAYWGALASDRRESLKQQLLNNELKALVATSALGMGFDKPDLGFVIHFQRPSSLIHYYQQVGRAGRSIDRAYGVLLSGNEDQEIAEYFMRSAVPLEAHIYEVLDALVVMDHGATPAMLEQRLNLTKSEIEKVLKSLAVRSPAPVSRRGGHWYRDPVPYEPDHTKIEQLTKIRMAEQAKMLEYLDSRACLMRFLAHELDSPEAAPCGRCAACDRGSLLPERYMPALANKAVQFLRQNDQHIVPRTAWPVDALAAHGWHGPIPAELQARPGRALCRWGDDGWGALVRQGKAKDTRLGLFGPFARLIKQWLTGRYPTDFDERLVAAVIDLVRHRWQPEPFPSWVTCIPSLKHPTLVPGFARRIAQELRLPFVPCAQKLCATAPQKTMQNTYQQAHNLANAFAVEARVIRSGPVLLVDDMVDSGWTFTAHLRGAGSGAVFPLALAVTTRTGNG